MSDAVIITLIVCGTLLVAWFLWLFARAGDSEPRTVYPSKIELPKWVTETKTYGPKKEGDHAERA